MGLVYDRTDSGLLVARHGDEGAAVAAALKDHDPDLRLVPQYSETYGGQYWSVYRYKGSERPSDHVCSWVDYDRNVPKPLSHGLVERVKELDRNNRSDLVEADVANARLREKNRLQAETEALEARDDWLAHGKKRHVLSRSQKLRQARTRTGYHDKKGR